MFKINETFSPTIPVVEIKTAVRVLATIPFRKVILISLDNEPATAPFRIDYDVWVELLETGQLERAVDRFILLPTQPPTLPKAAAKRLENLTQALQHFIENPEALDTSGNFRKAIIEVADRLNVSDKTAHRWICQWLQAGRNPVAVAHKFVHPKNKDTLRQKTGQKRGRRTVIQGVTSDAPAHEVLQQIERAFDDYIVKRKLTWKEAYNEMLICHFSVPPEFLTSDHTSPGLHLSPWIIEKYRIPSWGQFRYRCRILNTHPLQGQQENPRGKRGRARDEIPGPGYYEIDATGFQIQLVSRITKGLLVGRPTVYLVVDIYDGIIAGYSVTLENPSWAAAALALYNCFSDKGMIFERLGLPYKSEDWPCHHLPCLLRADRAELISNMGQSFSASGIRVEITPSMEPRAKGTVEGKHSLIKKPYKSRFDLPGLFSKHRERRQPDGKKDAALDIFEFERILVDTIMDLNGSPINSRQIPPDAIHLGAQVASRTGFHKWALENRPGFTRNMSPNFIFEHLLTRADAITTPYGLLFQGETYCCDRLRELGLLYEATHKHGRISVSFNPLIASEVYFFDTENICWTTTYNIDPEIYKLKASFSEVKEYRARQRLLTDQADLDNYTRRRNRLPAIRKSIKASIAQKGQDQLAGLSHKAQIRENRANERANERITISDLVNKHPSTSSNETIPLSAELHNSDIDNANDWDSLWDEVNER